MPLPSTEYIPDVGDIVWVKFDPQTGNEHKGYRPALVLSPKEYNCKTSLMIYCPMTTKSKGYPFEVILKKIGKLSVVLSDQVKSIDWKARQATFKGRASKKEVIDVKAKLKALLNLY
ncbi:endoribonuclease MazF [Thiotrichales bacterium 19X7-9]|nr:endoribonuclease MazF [Thiotrichales bacterium 19X7-9]